MANAKPEIIQTPNGPMQRILTRAPYAYYAVGLFCLLYSCIFPLYKLVHFLLMAGLAAAVFWIANKLSPVWECLIPYTEPTAETGNADADSALRQGGLYLNELRKLNAALPDETVTGYLNAIENSCSQIFAYIRLHPEQAPQLRKFMNYYLPTLLRLLSVRAELEAHHAEGENSSASKTRIDGMLAQATAAFAAFYDGLHAEQTMNVNAEISVFEAMLEQEGLLKDTGSPRPRTGGM